MWFDELVERRDRKSFCHGDWCNVTSPPLVDPSAKHRIPQDDGGKVVEQWLSNGTNTEEVQNYGAKVGGIHLLDTTLCQLVVGQIFPADGMG